MLGPTKLLGHCNNESNWFCPCVALSVILIYYLWNCWNHFVPVNFHAWVSDCCTNAVCFFLLTVLSFAFACQHAQSLLHCFLCLILGHMHAMRASFNCMCLNVKMCKTTNIKKSCSKAADVYYLFTFAILHLVSRTCRCSVRVMIRIIAWGHMSNAVVAITGLAKIISTMKH